MLLHQLRLVSTLGPWPQPRYLPTVRERKYQTHMIDMSNCVFCWRRWQFSFLFGSIKISLNEYFIHTNIPAYSAVAGKIGWEYEWEGKKSRLISNGCWWRNISVDAVWVWTLFLSKGSIFQSSLKNVFSHYGRPNMIRKNASAPLFLCFPASTF